MSTALPSPKSESGFTIVEVLVAIVLLLVGVLGTVTLVTNANAVSGTTKAREGAVNLAREVLEDLKSPRYADLTGTVPSSGGNTTLADDLVKLGLDDADLSAAGWQLRRRGITFELSLYTCVFDDGHDGVRQTGSTNPNGPYCAASSAGAATATDGNPDDFRQVEADITWSLHNGKTPSCSAGARSSNVSIAAGNGCVTQSELVANPSGGLGPNINVITQTTPPPGTVESGSSVSFSATTNTGADAINWTGDDGTSGAGQAATGNTDGTQWTFSWPLAAGILDGPHTLTVQAFLFGAGGVPKSKPVSINLRPPDPPQLSNPAGGVDSRIATDIAVATSWQPAADQDIIGYTVYRAPGNTDSPWVPDLSNNTPVCSTATLIQTTCFDEQNPAGAAAQSACPAGSSAAAANHMCVNYYVVAFDQKWASGNPGTCSWQNGSASGTVSIPSTPVSRPPLTTANPTLWANARPGCPSPVITVDYTAGAANAPPDPPTSALPTCTTSSGLAVINWTQPSNTTDTDTPPEPIVGYRVYRDPTDLTHPEYSSFVNVIGFGLTSYTDPVLTGGVTHHYFVTSLDSAFQESSELPVDWNPVTCP